MDALPNRILRPRDLFQAARVTGSALVVAGLLGACNVEPSPQVVKQTTPPLAPVATIQPTAETNVFGPMLPEAVTPDSMAQFITDGSLSEFELGALESKAPLAVHELKTVDGVPTYLHLYDGSVQVNVEAYQQAFNYLSSINPDFIKALEAGRKDGVDYQQVPNDPEQHVMFRHQIGDTADQTIGMALVPVPGVRGRHIIITSDDVPNWVVRNGVTRHRGETGVTVINLQRIRTMTSGNPEAFRDELERAAVVEVLQQTIYFAVGGGDGFLPSDHPYRDLGQEAGANGIALAYAGRMVGMTYEQVNLSYERAASTPIQMQNLPLHTMRVFPMTEKGFDSIPGSPLLLSAN